MVVQLRCPDALKALPFLTGHENVPSAHFGHRALRTFNWTITHEEKKQIISPSYYPPPPEPQKAVWFQLFSLLRRRRFVCTGSPGGHDSSPDVLWMDFISGPHAVAKCASELFSCAQGSVSWSPKPRKLQCSQAEKWSRIWTPAFACRWPPAHSRHDWKPGRVGCGFATQQRAQAFPSRKSYQFSIFCVPFSTSISFF